MTSATPLVGHAADPHVFLVGRPPLGEFLGFVTAQTVGGAAADIRELSDQWRAANDHVETLQQSEAGYADDPPVSPLPESLADLGRETIEDSVVQRTFAIVPIEVGIVELDRLVVWQKKINLSHVGTLQARLRQVPSEEEIYRLCLPSPAARFDPPTQAQPLGPNAFGFVSPSNDFRVLGTALVDPSTMSDLPITGMATSVVAVAVGYGANLLAAIRANGRLVLNNGSHRAYALRDAGVTHAPCLIQNVTRRDELAVIASGDFEANPDAYLSAPRPPVLRDYFDERLRMIAPVPRLARQLRVVFNQEALDVPIAS